MLTPPPKRLGVTHWSSRLLASRLGVSHLTIAEAWKQFGVKPWKAETFSSPPNPELEANVSDVIGLYLAPPENGGSVGRLQLTDAEVDRYTI